MDHEADYRALTRDGDYVWIRDVVHVVRRADGSVDALVGFMFDITERKQAEDARFGGEEFVLLLPATDEDAARNVAERCRKLLQHKEIPHARSGVGRAVTVSMGVGTIVPGAHDDRICDTET